MANRNSETIAKDFIKNNDYGSIITIIMVVGIMIQIMKVLQNCNTANNQEKTFGQMRVLGSKRSWWTQYRVKKILRQNLPNTVYNEYKDKLITDLLNYSECMSKSDFICLSKKASSK